MSATPTSVAATLRGRNEVRIARDLLEQLETIDDCISSHTASEATPLGTFGITHEEVADVLQRRRADVLRQLENKGIRVAPDSTDSGATVKPIESHAKAA